MGEPLREATVRPALEAALGRLLPAVLAQAGLGLMVKDAATGRVLLANDTMAAFVQQPAGRLTGVSEGELFDPSIAASLRAADQTAIAQGEPLVSAHDFEWQGQRRQFSVLRCVVDPEPGVPRLLCAVWTDQGPVRRRETQLAEALSQIEQQQRAHAQLERELSQQSMHDVASGLHSRAHFDEQLRRELDLSTREHREFALVGIEVDPLPESADAAVVQERVLEAMGRLLRGGTRAMDASARLDSRRFLVMLSGVGLATAHSRMESLRRRCATQIVAIAGRELRFTTSMGVASFPHTATDGDQLLSACEAALAEARRRGGNQVALASIRFEPG